MAAATPPRDVCGSVPTLPAGSFLSAAGGGDLVRYKREFTVGRSLFVFCHFVGGLTLFSHLTVLRDVAAVRFISPQYSEEARQ